MAKQEKSPILPQSPFPWGVPNSNTGNQHVSQNPPMPVKGRPFPGMPEGPCPVGPRDPRNKK